MKRRRPRSAARSSRPRTAASARSKSGATAVRPAASCTSTTAFGSIGSCTATSDRHADQFGSSELVSVNGLLSMTRKSPASNSSDAMISMPPRVWGSQQRQHVYPEGSGVGALDLANGLKKPTPGSSNNTRIVRPANAQSVESPAGGRHMNGQKKITLPKCRPIPYRLALAGGWIDQPFVSRTIRPPGSMVVVASSRMPYMDRSGIAAAPALSQWGSGPDCSPTASGGTGARTIRGRKPARPNRPVRRI